MVASTGEADIAVRGGDVVANIEDTIYAQVFVPAFVSEFEILGGNYFAAAAVPLEYVEVDSTFLGTPSNDAQGGLGDITLIPFGLTWKAKSLQTFLYTAVNVPVGSYEVGRAANLGLNYWAFDTNLGVTWAVTDKFNVNADFGLLVNTKNEDTDYLSGNSVHIDYSLGYEVTPRFSAAFSGYFYKQITGDTGSGAKLGDFKGEAVGIGPSVQYVLGNPKETFIVVNLAWQHDLYTKNRVKSDWVVVMLAFPID
jgi:hypothetical protein